MSDEALDPMGRVRYAVIDSTTNQIVKFGYGVRQDLIYKVEQDHHFLLEIGPDHDYPAGMIFDPSTNSLINP